MKTMMIGALACFSAVAGVAQESTVIADLAADYQPKAPSVGWAYQWNPTGVSVDDTAHYASLNFARTEYRVNSKPVSVDSTGSLTEGGNEVRVNGKEGTVRLDWILDGRNAADGSTDGKDHYVILAYTVQRGEGGALSIHTGGNNGVDGELRVYVGNSLKGTKAYTAAGNLNWKQSVGVVKEGQTVYLAFKSDSSQPRNQRRWYPKYTISRNGPVIAGKVTSATAPVAPQKSLIDYFLPMEPQGPLVSEGIWGNPNVLPRDIKNGLEDPTIDKWCYWDGKIVKSDDGRFHIYASRWTQTVAHSVGWRENSKAMHASSDNIMGPYTDHGLIWPHWKDGLAHNVIGLRMHDGRYAVVTSEVTPGEVFVSDSPDGPFKLLGQIQWDANGFHPGLAAYNGGTGNMSNVKIMLRPDGRYMLVGRSTAVMISDQGILGPYKIMTDRVYENYPELPQSKNEDPTFWYSGGMYHLVYNHWPTKTSHHFSSIDGINDWKYRGIAFKKGVDKVFRYPDGTVNDWEFIERPTAYVDEATGHVTHFIFSVIDVGKGGDRANDNHASKIVVVPFDGAAFDRDMQAIVAAENK